MLLRGPHTPVGTKGTEDIIRIIDSLEARSSLTLPVVVGRSSLAKFFVLFFFLFSRVSKPAPYQKFPT